MPSMAAAPSLPSLHGAARAADDIYVAGVGQGGVDELRAHVDDGTVSWALLRFEVGSGAFRRSKLIGVHFNGDGTSPVLRGRLNSCTKEVLKSMGATHATVEVKSAAEFTIEWLCLRLLPLFIADDAEVSVDAHALALAYAASLAATASGGAGEVGCPRSCLYDNDSSGEDAASVHGDAVTPASADAPTAVPPEAHGGVSSGLALRSRFDEPEDWRLLRAEDLEVHASGCGGLEAMKCHLDADQVLFGLVRFGFGGGNRGHAERDIVKHVFVHWIGPGVSAVRRGRLNAQASQARSLLVCGGCSVTLAQTAYSIEDVDLTDIIAELRRLAVVDGQAGSLGLISLEGYRASLKNSVVRGRYDLQSGRTGGYGAPASVHRGRGRSAAIGESLGEAPCAAKAVAVVRGCSGFGDSWNWALFHASPTSSTSALTPSPVAAARMRRWSQGVAVGVPGGA